MLFYKLSATSYLHICLGSNLKGCGSVVECFPNMSEALSLIPSTRNKTKQKNSNLKNTCNTCDLTIHFLFITNYYLTARKRKISRKVRYFVGSGGRKTGEWKKKKGSGNEDALLWLSLALPILSGNEPACHKFDQVRSRKWLIYLLTDI